MVIGNHAPGMNGGGVYDESQFATYAQNTYTNITLAGNNAINTGAGMYMYSGFATLTNATVTGNSLAAINQNNASNGDGAGIGVGRDGRLTVFNTTINGNSSNQGGEPASPWSLAAISSASTTPS